jgi:hypothetical protein
MLCQLEQQKMEHWKAVNAALVLAVLQVCLQILDWYAFLESFSANADHHEMAQYKTSTLKVFRRRGVSNMDVGGLDS